MHLWHIGALPGIFDSMFQYARDVHKYNTRYASDSKLHKTKVRTNIGKQKISFMAIDIWNNIPTEHKSCKKTYLFSKNIKLFLLHQQIMESCKA